MAWIWTFEDAEGNPVEAPDNSHSNQGDAESWVGLEWRNMVAKGASVAILAEDDRVEYRMDLGPAQDS
ncbi:hypothetical protein [Natronoglycomyces albus]|uniref:Uncharacterized protein n=1 Tax=Natronoglycomyces albus TaxID=2811108 RepID=A0A895XKM5_9ACTN|nr:hypothetical protein [Natronoglycomyces albus]QSB05607.1 hypothetical protein JQS30_01360 [Natronoglycomyces albus]